MDETVLLSTLCGEIGLAAGYGLAGWHQFLQDGRAMLLAFGELLEGYIPEDYERG